MFILSNRLTLAAPLIVTALAGLVTGGGAFANPPGKYASEKIVYGFTGGADGGYPYGQLTFVGPNIVGTTYVGGTGSLGTIFTLTNKGQLTTLHNFAGGISDGNYVTAGVIADVAGNLYGTTGMGGTSNAGIIYKLDTTGALTVMHSFADCSDGALPIYGTLALSQGILYGVTSEGALENTCPAIGGTAFQIGTDGSNYKVSHVFMSTSPKKGYNPVGAVAISNGSVFGTTQAGGRLGHGTVFQIDAAGKESVLLPFRDKRDGDLPAGGVILGKDGRLYGTTEFGDSKYQLGTVFAVDTSGKQTVLHEFTGKHGEGAYPVDGLVQDASGDLFGTTQQGGTADGNGTVFEITAAGAFITLHRFQSGTSDGQNPFTGLTIAPDGDLYGTTAYGGLGGYGVVFKVTPNK